MVKLLDCAYKKRKKKKRQLFLSATLIGMESIAMKYGTLHFLPVEDADSFIQTCHFSIKKTFLTPYFVNTFYLLICNISLNLRDIAC